MACGEGEVVDDVGSERAADTVELQLARVKPLEEDPRQPANNQNRFTFQKRPPMVVKRRAITA